MTSITASAPATATANGDSPDQDRRNDEARRRSARLRPRPTSDSAPRRRPNSTTSDRERERQPDQRPPALEVGERVASPRRCRAPRRAARGCGRRRRARGDELAGEPDRQRLTCPRRDRIRARSRRSAQEPDAGGAQAVSAHRLDLGELAVVAQAAAAAPAGRPPARAPRSRWRCHRGAGDQRDR